MFRDSLFSSAEEFKNSSPDTGPGDKKPSGIYLIKDTIDKIVDCFIIHPELKETWEFIIKTRSDAKQILREMEAILRDANDGKDLNAFDQYRDKIVRPEAIRAHVTRLMGTQKDQLQQLMPRKVA